MRAWILDTGPLVAYLNPSLRAERVSVYEILTLDYRGFTVFRSSSGKSFSMVLPHPGFAS